MRFRCSSALIVSALATASPLMLSGQAVPDRRFLDSIITAAQVAATATAVPSLSRCDDRDLNVKRICQVVISVYHSPLAGKLEEVFASEDLAVSTVFEQDRWAYAWYALGLVRLQLAHDKVLPHEGPALPTGMSNELGGANALIHALELDPTLAVAANALALAPEPREGVDVLGPRVAVLRQVRALLSPAANASAAILERDAGSPDSAVALERRALAAGGVDSGVVFLSLARDLYRTNRPKEGRAALIAGASATTDHGRKAYRTELAWVATAEELIQWDSLPTRDRPAWLAGFWSGRDVVEGRLDGERLIEHYRRVEYAMAHFRIGEPDTDRERTLRFLRSDEYVPEQQSLSFAARNANLCPQAARFATDARLYGADAPTRYFQPSQDVLDDRGAVWIRHGPPTKSRQSNGIEGVEIWRYERPEGSLVLQFRKAAFRGTSGVSVLVPSLMTISPGLRNQVCPLEPSICSRLGVTGPIQPGDTILIRSSAEVGLWGERVPPVDPVTHRATRMPPTASSVSRLERLTERCDDPVARVLEREVHSAGTLLSTAAILKARDEGRGQIDLATTTDTYHRDFARAIHPALQVFGADVAAGGAPRVVIAFALSADELMPVKSESSPASGSYPVQMQVMAANLSNGRRIDIDTVRRLSAQGTSGRGRTVTGLVEVPLPAGAYSVGVVLSQADGRGALAAARGVTLPRATAQLTVSDMVLGRENSGVQWNSGATNVALNPLGTYPKGGSAEVYFQLSGMTAGHTYQSKFEFFRADDAPDHGARLVISFAQPASQDRIEVSRTLGLKNLDAGRYRVKLTVSGDSLQTTATGWLTIEK